MKPSAFTMIEMLVAVTILGILIGLAIPVIGNVQEKARSAETMSRLRTLQIANVNYANDHHGQFMPLYTGTSFLSTGWKWNEAFLAYLSLTPESIGTLAWQKVVFPAQWSQTGKPYADIAYFVDSPWFAESLASQGLPSGQIANPETLIAFIDANDWWVHPYSFNDWPGPEADQAGSGPSARVAYRHRGGKAAAIAYGGNLLLLERADLDPFTDRGAKHWFYFGNN